MEHTVQQNTERVLPRLQLLVEEKNKNDKTLGKSYLRGLIPAMEGVLKKKGHMQILFCLGGFSIVLHWCSFAHTQSGLLWENLTFQKVSKDRCNIQIFYIFCWKESNDLDSKLFFKSKTFL